MICWIGSVSGSRRAQRLVRLHRGPGHDSVVTKKGLKKALKRNGEFGTKKNRYWEQKGIATKGARTLRTGLLAVLLGARGCYERSLFGTKKPKTWAVAERKPRAGQRTPRAGLRDTRSEGVAREASEQKRQLFGASHLEKDLYLSSISAYIYIYMTKSRILKSCCDKFTGLSLRDVHFSMTQPFFEGPRARFGRCNTLQC